MQSESSQKLEVWQRVWQRKGQAACQRLDSNPQKPLELGELLAFNGYDSAAATMNEARWRAYMEYISQRLELAPGAAVCEVGCGAGAMLWPLRQLGLDITGVDYAEGLIRVCRDLMPEAHFAVGEAARLPLASERFDAVWSNGVCMYYPDLEYAEAAFAEKVRILKPGGRMALLDVNDAACRAEYVAIKTQALGADVFQRMYEDHRHLFYSRSGMTRMAEQHGLDAIVEDQRLPGYPNAAFRFNAIFLKRR